MAVKRQQTTVLYCKACVHIKAYKVPGTLCGKRQVINQMSHRGQIYRVYNRSSVVVKRSSIQSVIALPGRTTLASRARKLRPGILTHESIDRKKNTELYEVLLYCIFFSFLFFFHLTYSRWTSSLPSCLWSQRIFPSLPGSRLTIFLSRCKFSTLTTRQPMVEFYLLTFQRFPLRKKENKSYFGKNRTHDFRTSRCAAYLLDHSGDELQEC